MPCATARRQNTTLVQLGSNGADAGEPLRANVIHNGYEVSRAALSVRFHGRYSLGIACLLASERPRAIGIAQLNTTSLSGGQSGCVYSLST